MTVRELIQILTTMPPELLVVSEGYENGFDSIKAVRYLKVENNENKNWWDGELVESDKNSELEVVFFDTKRKYGN